jgi:hypothetical protein
MKHYQGEKAIVGWERIWRAFFFTENGKPLISLRTLQKHKHEMFRAGVLSKTQLVPGRPPQVFTFPSLMLAWISTKMAKGELFPKYVHGRARAKFKK